LTKAGLEKVKGPIVSETRVAVGRVGVTVAGIGVAVGGTIVTVAGTGVAVAGIGVAVGGTIVAVAGTGVAVAGIGVVVGCKVGDGAQATTINASAKSRTKYFIIYLFTNYFPGILS